MIPKWGKTCLNSFMNILIIDDIQQTREGLHKLLSSYGHIVDTATNGKEAILKIQIKKYDIAFVDMILPDTDGVNLMKKINRLNPSTFLILTYDKLDENLRTKLGGFMKAGGHFHFFEKPFSEEEVIRTLESKKTY